MAGWPHCVQIHTKKWFHGNEALFMRWIKKGSGESRVVARWVLSLFTVILFLQVEQWKRVKIHFDWLGCARHRIWKQNFRIGKTIHSLHWTMHQQVKITHSTIHMTQYVDIDIHDVDSSQNQKGKSLNVESCQLYKFNTGQLFIAREWTHVICFGRLFCFYFALKNVFSQKDAKLQVPFCVVHFRPCVLEPI